MPRIIKDTLARLVEKSEAQHFGYQLNLTILEAKTIDGKRDIDKEDFINIDELRFSEEWLPQFYQDIIDGNIDTKSPNFWERWEYYRRAIPADSQPTNFSQAESIALPLKKTHARTAQRRKQRIIEQRLNDLLKSVEAEKDLTGLDPQALSKWHEEAIIEAVYNAILLEKSITREMVEVNAMSREAILHFLWENKKSDLYSEADYAEIERIYFTFKLTTELAKERRMLTNEAVIHLANMLFGDGTPLSYFIDPNHPTLSKLKLKALAKYIDTYNQEKEQYPILLAIARFYTALIGSKLFKKYNETMWTAIINLELQKYGYPFIVIRRRDLFFIEGLNGHYYLYNTEPQTYVELICRYVEVELLSIHYYCEKDDANNDANNNDSDDTSLTTSHYPLDNDLMNAIATQGIKKLDDSLETQIHAFVEKNEHSENQATKKLVDAVVNQYEKATFYAMFDDYAYQKAEPIITLNQLLRKKDHQAIAHVLQDELSKRTLKQKFISALNLKENMALNDFLQILDKLDLEIIVREKLETPEKSFRPALCVPKPTQIVTEITQEHIDWWDNLPELWQKIFCVALYHPKLIARKFREGYYTDYDYSGDKDEPDTSEPQYILGYSPLLRDTHDLLALFKVKQIFYMQNVNPPVDKVVTFIPSMHYFSELEILTIDSNYLEDISNLASLTTLKALNLNECFTITDYSPIGALTNLLELKLGFNYIDDVGFVKNLTKLKHLYLLANKIEDVTALSSLTNLVYLELGSNPIKDVRPLATLKNLKEISLGNDEPYYREFDATYVEWLKEQLPDTKFDLY